jgi:hypothetical protein
MEAKREQVLLHGCRPLDRYTHSRLFTANPPVLKTAQSTANRFIP